MKSLTAGLAGALSVVLGTAFVCVSAAALLGRGARPDIYKTGILVVVVLAAILFPWPDDDSWRRGAAIGIVVGVAGVVGYGLAGGAGIGPSQIGAFIGGLFTFPLLGLARSGVLGSRFVRLALLLLVVVVVVALVQTIVGGGAFGHDESAYVLKARSWLQGTPDTGWSLHRAPAVSFLAMPVVAFTQSEVAVRLVGSVLSVAALVGVILVAQRMGGLWPALIAGATVGVSLPYLRRGAEYLTDVPAAGVLLFVVTVVLIIVAKPDASRHLVIWLGPLVAIAFYVRYQSALSVIGIAAATAIIWPGVVKRLWRPLLLSAGIAVAAIVPHLIWATRVADSPLGVILATEEAGGAEYPGQGLVDYAHLFAKDLAGPVGAVLMAVGLLWIGWSLVTGWRRRTDDARLAGFVAIVVAVAVVPLGLVAHAEPRFVFFPVWLLIATGAHAVVRLGTRLGARPQVALVAIASIVWVPLFAETAGRADRNAEARAAGFQVVVDASEYIEMDAPGSCGVMTSYQPQVTWYSECFTDRFGSESVEQDVDGLEGDTRYVLVFENGKRQPGPERIEAYLMLGPVSEIDSTDDSIGDATVVEVDEDVQP